MVIDHRTYTFRPGRMDRWLKKYESEGLAIQKRHLGRFVGLYTTDIGNLHQVVFMWEYESVGDREKRRAAMAEDPAWQNFITEVWALDAIVSQEISILRPARFSPDYK